MKNNISILIIFLASVLACKPVQKTTSRISDREANKIIENLNKYNPEFKYLKAKAKIRFVDNEDEQELSLNLRIVKDSIIWGSVSALLGIEIGRFFINQQGVTLIDKFNKKYSELPFSKLQALLVPEINYNFSEDLILGIPAFMINREMISKKENDQITLNSNDQEFRREVIVDASSGRIKKYSFEHVITLQKILFEYSGRISDKNVILPGRVQINISLPEQSIIFVEFSSIKINEFFSVNANIPKGYSKME